jgi:hypothetical protein
MARYIRDLFTKEYRWEEDSGPVRIVYGKAEAKRSGGLQVIPDIEPFISPLDGSVVSGRRQRRDHMRAHGVVEVGNEKLRVRNPEPLPPVQHDIKAAIEMVRGGYRPPSLGRE